MKLRQQFDSLVPIEFGGEMYEPLRDKCTQIAENFAIGFAEWIDSDGFKHHVETKRLLEIYKKTL